MWETIKEYERSCSLLRTRIGELSARITGREPLESEDQQSVLQNRRHRLYEELSDMERAIYEMRQYLGCDDERKDAANF